MITNIVYGSYEKIKEAYGNMVGSLGAGTCYLASDCYPVDVSIRDADSPSRLVNLMGGDKDRILKKKKVRSKKLTKRG